MLLQTNMVCEMSMYDYSEYGILDLVPCIYRYFNECYQNCIFSEHQHDTYEIDYIVSGKCRMTVVDSKTGDSNTVTLKAGQYVFIRENVKHSFVVDRGSFCRFRNVELIFKNCDSLPTLSVLASDTHFSKFLTALPDYCVIHDDGILISCFSLLQEILSESYKQQMIITESPSTKIVLNILLLLQRMAEQIDFGTKDSNKSDLYIHKAINYIMENYENTEKISVRDIAQYVCIAPTYLQRIFKREMGMTIIEYISSVRLEKAKSLLRRTDMPVLDIALNVGYTSRQRLFQLFMENEGISPGQYRKNCRG